LIDYSTYITINYFFKEKNMKYPELKIGDLIAKVPIIQGGMGVGISLSNLAAAVANEGGIGVISAAMIGFLEKDIMTNFIEANIRALKREIQKAKDMTKGIVGVNIMVALSNYADMVITSIKEKADIIFAGAGLPLDLPKYLVDGAKTKLVPIVSSAKAAKIIILRWLQRFNYLPDAFVVEGPKAGGHLGFKPQQIFNSEFDLKIIVKQVIETVKPFAEKFKKNIPVIAAGGIYSKEDIKQMIDLGADGVQMGTRFVSTEECDADIEFKKSYINAKKEDIEIIKSPVGLPGRAINNKFLEDVNKGIKKPFKCPYHCIKTCNFKEAPYCISIALANAQKGRFDYGFAFAGSNAYRIDKITTVKELIKELVG